MSVCVDCINDEHIQSERIVDRCLFCGESKENCISDEDLLEELAPIFSIYSPIEYFMPTEILKESYTEYNDIAEVLKYEWSLFSEIGSQKLLDYFIDVTRGRKGESDQLFHSNVYSENEFYGKSDEEQERFNEDQWDKFCKEIKTKNRFHLKESIDLEKLATLLFATYFTKPASSIFFRARNCNGKNNKFSIEEMGKPPNDKVKKPGRANPVGISYLYLCSNKETTAYEIRSSLLDKITIGEFISIEPLHIIDLADIKSSPFIWMDDLESMHLHLALIKVLGNELSKPIGPDEEDIEYIPSQFLCEFIKNQGFDGIKFQSLRGNGYNFVIFNDHKLTCTQTYLFEIIGVINPLD